MHAGGAHADGPPLGTPRAYKCTKDYRKVAMGSTRPWPSILQSIDPVPTNVVLQAITPAMLRDATTCSVRSTAFAVYNKVALAEQGSRCPQPPVSAAWGAGSGSQPLQGAAGLVEPGVGQSASGGSGSGRRHKRWVGCYALSPLFKLAQVDMGPSIKPPAIEKGQQPPGWLEGFRVRHQPGNDGAAAVPSESPPATKGYNLISVLWLCEADTCVCSGSHSSHVSIHVMGGNCHCVRDADLLFNFVQAGPGQPKPGDREVSYPPDAPIWEPSVAANIPSLRFTTSIL